MLCREQSHCGEPKTRQSGSKELTSDDAQLKELPLRRDVRSLGRLLGEVLKEQAGRELFDAVEQLRLLPSNFVICNPIKTRGPPGEHELMSRAREIVSRMTIGQAYQMTKAFATYFELTNLAETNHRKRRRRAHELRPDRQPEPGTFRGTLASRAAMRASGQKKPSHGSAK